MSRLPQAFVFVLSMACASAALAEPDDAVEGRLVLSAAYGFDAVYYQEDRASSVNPDWGHGAYFRLGGERCGTICVGLSVLGSVGVAPEGSGSVGVGPHIGYLWGGPSWAGRYVVRFGAAYYHSWTPTPSFTEDGELVFGDVRDNSGVGAWVAIGLELMRRAATITPVVGIRGRYVAVLPSADGDDDNFGDTVEHHISGQIFFALAFGRRLVFGEGAELDLGEEGDGGDRVDDERDSERPMELDEDEERILREAEDELRR